MTFLACVPLLDIVPVKGLDALFHSRKWEGVSTILTVAVFGTVADSEDWQETIGSKGE